MYKQYSGPNEAVLEAQARVCTGPHQTRPLGTKATDAIQPDAILETILKSVKGELPVDQAVSEAQMGAFFAAMTIRKGFPEATQWSEAELAAFDKYGADLAKLMPPEIQFIMNPDRGYKPANPAEKIIVKVVEKILAGGHLTYDETRHMGKAILTGKAKEALTGAALIGQRMNLETYDEVRGYLDAVFEPEQVRHVAVDSLTHFGEPFDGATRYFRPTLFIAAVRAALGEASVLHGVDAMPPKNGVTEEKILQVLGARTNLSLEQAAALIEAPEVGFAYVSQREYSPGAYGIRELRVHIKKRPPWSATEKAQQLFSAPGANYMVIGYYHPGYEEPLLRLIWERGFQAGLVVKGEEGTSHYALRLGSPSTGDRQAVNYSQGFRRVGEGREDFALDLDPKAFGFNYEKNPRLAMASPEAFAEAGMAALSGGRGPIYDRLVLNTAMTDHLLGLCPDVNEAIERTKAAIDSGRALSHLKAYIEKSRG
ncbi:MAG: hypothetical protein O7E52_18520 [Candidatus Poribacteria bacterium]|nr:hypothetical protein [Candidatus Poribacteria bacterium]